MRRRDVLTLLGGAAVAWPFAIQAQTAKLRRIFWVSTKSQPDPFVDGFREGLRERGYVEGKNVILELRYAPGNPDALRTVLAELTRGNADLAVSSGPAIRAMRAATIFPCCLPSAAIRCKSVSSKALRDRAAISPAARSFRSTSPQSGSMCSRKIFPKLRRPRCAVEYRSSWRAPGMEAATQQAAQKLSIEPVYVPFVGAQELDNALATVGDARADAMLVSLKARPWCIGPKWPEFAIAQKLPSMFGWSEYCDAGGLLSYGAGPAATYFRLRPMPPNLPRQDPADLPVEQPTSWSRSEFVKKRPRRNWAI